MGGGEAEKGVWEERDWKRLGMTEISVIAVVVGLYYFSLLSLL